MSNDREGTPPLWVKSSTHLAAYSAEEIDGKTAVYLPPNAKFYHPPIPEPRLRAADAAGARADREAGIRWQADARAYVLTFGGTREAWLGEDARRAWDQAGLPSPPDSRAWGAILAGLSRAKLIYAVGARRDAFGSLKTLWTIAGRHAPEATP